VGCFNVARDKTRAVRAKLGHVFDVAVRLGQVVECRYTSNMRKCGVQIEVEGVGETSKNIATGLLSNDGL
jgi:hypothetical protein